MLLLSHFLLLSFQCRPSWREKTQAQWMNISNTHTHTHTHTLKGKSVWNLSFSVGGNLGAGAVWSHRGQTVARHPEEFPLCLCTATSCNLLLRDKTKLTPHFRVDLAVPLRPRAPNLRQTALRLSRLFKDRLMVIIHHEDTPAHADRRLSTFSQVLVCNLSCLLPCGIIGDFPTLTTSESTVVSVGREKTSTQAGDFTCWSKQHRCKDLWTEVTFYQLVTSTLLPVTRCGG